MNFRRGDCSILAVAIHDVTRLPLWGLFDEEGSLHHVFVSDGDVVIDYDGKRPLKGAFARYHGDQPRPLTRSDIRALPTYSDSEWDEAVEEAAVWAEDDY